MKISAAHPWWHWALLLISGVVLWAAPFPAHAASPVEHTFRIDARRFAYDPAVIQVNQGDPVTIELVADDVVHGLSVDGYNVAVTADPGQTARLSFVANRQGTFRFRCTTTCGSLHPFMVGKLEVGQNTLLWRLFALSALVVVAGLWMGKQ